MCKFARNFLFFGRTNTQTAHIKWKKKKKHVCVCVLGGGGTNTRHAPSPDRLSRALQVFIFILCMLFVFVCPKNEKEEIRILSVRWYFEPSQPQRIIISGLKTYFNLSPSYSANKSSNQKISKICKISPDKKIM